MRAIAEAPVGDPGLNLVTDLLAVERARERCRPEGALARVPAAAGPVVEGGVGLGNGDRADTGPRPTHRDVPTGPGSQANSSQASSETSTVVDANVTHDRFFPIVDRVRPWNMCGSLEAWLRLSQR